MDQRLSKKDERELQRHRAQFRSKVKIISWTFVIIAVVLVVTWTIASQPKISESEIVSRSGFHWHPELTIYVKGEKLEIPENIGIGTVHQPIHTHDDSDQGIVHMEFQGLVRNQDITLGQFFKNWGKDIRSFGVNMKMTINGEENTEYEKYIMGDRDKIELRYE